MDAGIQDDLKIVGEDVWSTVPPYSEYLRTVRLVAADAAVRAGLDYDEVEDFRIAVDELCHLLMSSTDHEISVSFGVVGRSVLARGRAQRRSGGALADAQRAVAHDHRLGRRPPRGHRQRRRARVRGDEERSGADRGRHAGRAMTDSPDTYEKFTEYRRTGDRALRNELVEEHVRLAEFLARRFSHRGEPPDDLRQVALGRPPQGGRALRARPRAAVLVVRDADHHRRAQAPLPRPGLGGAGAAPHPGAAPRARPHRERPQPGARSAADAGRDRATRRGARGGRAREHGSRAACTGSRRSTPADPTTSRARAPRSDSASSTPSWARSTIGSRSSEMLAVLPEREQNIVYLRFFEGLTQSEIAERIGISQMHVSRLLARSLETLGEHASAVAEA